MARSASRRTLNAMPAALYLGRSELRGQPVAVIELVKDTTEYEAAAASSAAQSHSRHPRHSCRRPLLAFLLGRGLFASVGGDHHRNEPPLEWRYRCHDSRQRAKRRTRAAWRWRLDVFPPQHDRGAHAAARRRRLPNTRPNCEKKALQREMPTVESDVKGLVGAVARATQDMQRVAGEITTSVNGTSARATAAGRRLEEASASVSTVATATEELASSVTEIGRQVTFSSGVADRPVARPRKPPKWSEALPPPPKRSAMCCA